MNNIIDTDLSDITFQNELKERMLSMFPDFPVFNKDLEIYTNRKIFEEYVNRIFENKDVKSISDLFNELKTRQWVQNEFTKIQFGVKTKSDNN